jgi:hypothetical protein
MNAAATTWNYAPPDNNRLTDLLKFFGCPDAIASLDVDAFGKRSAELIRQATIPQTVPVQSAVTLGRSELRSITERSSLLNALHNAPRSDRLTLIATAAASTSLLIAAGAVLSD